jgi:hypothetical protein
VTVGSRIRRAARRFGGPVEIPRTAPLPPVFVGGTGRSGTTITARILGAHPLYLTFAKELKFIVAGRGLADLVAGKSGMDAFRQRMLGDWLDRTTAEVGGSVVDRALVETALDRLDVELGRDRWAAAAAFTHRVLDPLALAADARGWVEMTPDNAVAAPALLRLFPDARIIHCVRDGRDAACSIVSRSWGPNDADEALDWWATRLDAALRAGAAIAPDRWLTIRMESLIIEDREAQYARLLDFAGLDDHPDVRTFFAQWVTAERAHVGRWREEIGPDRVPAFEAHYRDVLDGLARRWPGLSLAEA